MAKLGALKTCHGSSPNGLDPLGLFSSKKKPHPKSNEETTPRSNEISSGIRPSLDHPYSQNLVYLVCKWIVPNTETLYTVLPRGFGRALCLND